MKMLVLLKIIIFAAVILLNSCDCYKILGIFPAFVKSHYIVGSSLLKGLAEKGHDVTVISAFPSETPLKNYRDIPVQKILESTKQGKEALVEMRNLTFAQMFTGLFEFGELLTNSTLEEKSVQDLMKSNEKFDVVIMDVFINEATLGLPNYFNAPVIGFSSFGASLWTCEMVGSPSPPSFVPSPFSTFTDRMNIFQRIGNLLIAGIEKIIYEYYHIPKQEALYEKYFPNPKPKLRKLIRNVSLVLLNSHFSLDYPRPYSTNMIEIGGIHVNRNPKSVLPENLQQFLDSAKEGVIYFSMGSNLPSIALEKEKIDALVKAFASLKQKILWKWEDETLPGKPSNVLISDWFPQDDLLAHPNVKMFITHGGLLSITESIYHGVPILAIPIFGDQFANAARIEKAGYGRSLAYDDVNVESLKEIISEILSENAYRENVKVASMRLRDRPMDPLETAIYWVEYVARHKGAYHLRSAGQNLSFIQYHNLDSFGLIVFIIFLVFYLIRKICKKLFHLFQKEKVKLE